MGRPRRLDEVPLPASKRQIDIAGDRIRDWWLDDSLPDTLLAQEPLRSAIDLLSEFRAGFQDPLNAVTMSVRSFVRSEGAPIIVAQRLKRVPTIVNKLGRYPGMKLSRMQDIGGCRAIVPTRAQVEGIVDRIEQQQWPVLRADDYTATPKDTGYRAVHIVVSRWGRSIEVQLRTPWQQRWAQQVDRVGGRLGIFLKDGEGPPALVRYFERVALALAIRETGGEPDDDLGRELFGLRAEVQEYLREGRRKLK